MKLSKIVEVCNGVNFMKKEIADNGGLIILNSTYKDKVGSFDKTVKAMIEEGYKKITVAIKDGSTTYIYDTLCNPDIGFIEAYKMVGGILGF